MRQRHPAGPVRVLPAVIAVLLGSAGCSVTIRTQDADGASLVARAERFMEGYAEDLRTGNREAIIARYDTRGGYLVGNGRKEFVPFDSTRAYYLTAWSPPASFEWHDLSYEPVGDDAVVVTGRFTWGRPSGPLQLSYTGLLLRHGDDLRIRLEDESLDPRTLPSPPVQGARTEIAETLQRYQRAAGRLDIDSMASFFTADGVLFEPGIRPIVTRDSIRAFLSLFPGTRVFAATASADTVDVFGERAYVWGSYFEHLSFPGQPESQQHGRFVSEWRREGGAWRIAKMYRVPLPAPPPPRRD